MNTRYDYRVFELTAFFKIAFSTFPNRALRGTLYADMTVDSQFINKKLLIFAQMTIALLLNEYY